MVWVVPCNKEMPLYYTAGGGVTLKGKQRQTKANYQAVKAAIKPKQSKQRGQTRRPRQPKTKMSAIEEQHIKNRRTLLYDITRDGL